MLPAMHSDLLLAYPWVRDSGYRSRRQDRTSGEFIGVETTSGCPGDTIFGLSVCNTLPLHIRRETPSNARVARLYGAVGSTETLPFKAMLRALV